MALSGEHCYMTLLMSDSYLPGAMVLAHSLRDTGTTTPLVALVTLDTVSKDVINELKTMYHIVPVERIPNPKPANLFLMGRPDLLYTFTKIALWRQTQYSKIIYMDADMVALQNLDHLFGLDESFAAAPDIGWPDAFNSGFMVLTPSMGEYWALQTLAQSGDSFDGADQGLLNQYYQSKNWHRLSFTYNCTPNAEYQWEPAYRYHKSNIKAVHYIGKNKPWTVGRPRNSGNGVYSELLGKWWSVYDGHYKQSPAYVPGKSYARSVAVQQRVFGESIDMFYGLPPEERLPPTATTEVAPMIQAHTPQPPNSGFLTLLEDPPEQAVIHDTQHHVPVVSVQEPTPEIFTSEPQQPSQSSEPSHSPQSQQFHQEPEKFVNQQPRPEFAAPAMEWDATREAPPPQSRPEAAHFPTQQYTFEDRKRAFYAPQQYPEPPKDMWYSVPESKPSEEPPKPIFPWEQQTQRPQTTRIFSEDYPPSPQMDQPGSPPSTTWAENTGGMEKYIRNIMVSMSEKAKDQSDISPIDRRESLIFTGLPALEDRPSLPVTPAPIMTTPFWADGQNTGEEEISGQSEGLSEQAEWNPDQRLEDLRRSSLVEIEELAKPGLNQSSIPARSLPGMPVSAPSQRTSVLAPKPSSALSNPPLLPQSSSDDMSSLELGTEKPESKTVSRLEAAAMKEKVIKKSSENTTVDVPAGIEAAKPSKVQFINPSFGNYSETGSGSNNGNNRSQKSPGSFSAETALEESTISPTER